MWYRMYGLNFSSLMLVVVMCSQNMWRYTEANIKLFTLRTLSSSMHPNVLKTSPNKLPIPPLDDVDFIKNRPKRKHLKPEKLLQLMGEDFNSAWMSIEKPYIDPQDAIVTIKRTVDTKLLPDLNELNFTYLDENGDLVPMKSHVQKAFEKWLLQKASCPVQFVWEDIGAFFWPRWLKQGICLNENSPCSWPPGMHCVPAESHHMNVLRWHCRRRNNNNKGGGRRRGSRSQRRRDERRHNSRQDDDDDADDHGATATEDDTAVIADPEVTAKDLLTERRRASKNNKKSKLRCKWIKVPYPVTAECFCSC